MQNVRDCLDVESVRWKIEKRVLERKGHVVRIRNEMLTKEMVFGWYEGSEEKDNKNVSTEPPMERVRFEYRRCGLVRETEVACLNDEIRCG